MVLPTSLGTAVKQFFSVLYGRDFRMLDADFGVSPFHALG